MIKRTLTLLSIASVTTTTNGAAMSTQTGAAKPVSVAISGATQHMKVYLDVPTVTATAATLDLTIQGRPIAGQGTWFTLAPLTGEASAAWTQVTTANTATCAQTRDFQGPIPAELRAVLTTSGTTPSYVVNVYADLGDT